MKKNDSDFLDDGALREFLTGNRPEPPRAPQDELALIMQKTEQPRKKRLCLNLRQTLQLSGACAAALAVALMVLHFRSPSVSLQDGSLEQAIQLELPDDFTDSPTMMVGEDYLELADD